MCKKISASHKKVLKKDNISILAFIMLYVNKNTTMFKVLGSAIYFIMKEDICGNYLSLYQDTLLLAHKGFENTAFNEISGIGIPEVLMNIMPCSGFVD